MKTAAGLDIRNTRLEMTKPEKFWSVTIVTVQSLIRMGLSKVIAKPEKIFIYFAFGSSYHFVAPGGFYNQIPDGD